MLGNVDGDLEHSTRFVLIDRKSRVRGYYLTSEDDAHPAPHRRRQTRRQGPILTVHDLPTLNAILNGTAAILLTIGYILIRNGKREAHQQVMIAAFCTSVLFLISYLIYHAQVGSKHYHRLRSRRSISRF